MSKAPLAGGLHTKKAGEKLPLQKGHPAKGSDRGAHDARAVAVRIELHHQDLAAGDGALDALIVFHRLQGPQFAAAAHGFFLKFFQMQVVLNVRRIDSGQAVHTSSAGLTQRHPLRH